MGVLWCPMKTSTYSRIVIPVVGSLLYLDWCQAIPIPCLLYNITTPTTNTTTTNNAYDAEGAMKFTITLVLVFGIGVIGLLGIYHHRNVNEDLSDKEADEFVKRFERKRYNLEKQYRKKLMKQLVESFFSRTLRVKTRNPRKSVQFTLRPTLSEPNLAQSTLLLADLPCHPYPNQPANQQGGLLAPPRDHLPEPINDVRTRSKSFNVPRTGGLHLKRLEAIERVSLMRPLLRDSPVSISSGPWDNTDTNSSPRLTSPTPSSEGWMAEESGEEDSGEDQPPSPHPALRLQMGGGPVVPTIMVNDTQV